VAEPQDSARHDVASEVSAFLAGLDEQERMLIVLCRQLYEGQWDDMLQDLQDRLEGRSHVFEWGPPSPRLRTTIADHMAIIHRLRAFERDHGVSLTELVNEEP
jgi:hypothetical protein